MLLLDKDVFLKSGILLLHGGDLRDSVDLLDGGRDIGVILGGSEFVEIGIRFEMLECQVYCFLRLGRLFGEMLIPQHRLR